MSPTSNILTFDKVHPRTLFYPLSSGSGDPHDLGPHKKLDSGKALNLLTGKMREFDASALVLVPGG